MDETTLLVVIGIVLLFGRQLWLAVFGVGGGVFSNANAVPGPPNGLPASTIQNQVTGNPVTKPAPWRTPCQVAAGATQPPATGLGLVGSSAGMLNLPTATSDLARPVTGRTPSFFQ